MILSNILSDGMVLQRGASVLIWGNTTPSRSVNVSFLDQSYRTESDSDGNWQVELNNLEAGGPYEMIISAEGEPDTIIRDILVGEVWVLSGQSNMQLPVSRTLDLFEEEVADADFPFIRQFTVPQRYEFHGPREDLPEGQWMSATSDNVLDFSAAGFFFARELYRTYGVPIGLVQTAIGGTPVEAWMSEPLLLKFGGYEQTLDQCKDDRWIEETIRQEQEAGQRWFEALNQADLGLQEGWQQPELVLSADWQPIQVPGRWFGTELADVRGAVWLRREFDVPESMLRDDEDLKLKLGTIVDADTTYVNGVEVGNTPYKYPPRRYSVPRNLLKPGKNVIAVRVISTANIGGFITDMPYTLISGKQELELSGTWHYRIGAATESAPAQTFFQYKPSGLYNGMITPIRRYRMRGVLWYQGESNCGRPKGYSQLFSAMIREWRELWNIGEFPFIFTQLTNYDGDDGPQPGRVSSWAPLRNEQRLTLDTPNTAMAVTIDIGEANDLHPQDKKTLGIRLALCARKLAYGEDIVYSGPLYAGMKVHEQAIHLQFDHIGGGLVARGDGPLRGFEICAEDGVFVPAQAEIFDEQVIVSHDQIQHPQHVRYAWADNPSEANLYNAEGLPASPFTTESV